MKEKTIFEKIIDNEIPSYKIFEDDKIIVILDAFPKKPGHSLFIPKIKKENFLEENNEIIEYIFTKIKDISKLIEQKLNNTGFKIVSNVGSSAGQIIFHTHFHLIPYFDENKTPNLSIEEVYKKLTL